MKTNWINVKDKLPPFDIGVLVTDVAIVTVAQRYKFDLTSKKLWWTSHGYGGYEWDFDFDPKDITHWAELPEPPRP